MKIQYLGTAAAEGTPALFCECPICRRARELGGRNVRTRSQALIDGKLLLDFPCDSLYHFLLNGIRTSEIHHVLVTHVHGDHLYGADLEFLRPGYSHLPEDYRLTFHGSPDTFERLRDWVPFCAPHLILDERKPFEPFSAGDYTVTAFPAVHGTPHPYVYLIEDGEKSIFYCHDSGIPKEDVFSYFSEYRKHIDLVSLDCTEGAHEDIPYDAHMCLGRAEKVKARLISDGVCDEKTVFVLNHFSHNGLSNLYEDMRVLAAERGFVTAYDGMTAEF